MKKLIFWLLIFLLPTQLGIHFWPEFSFVAGFKIDYLSPTIYLTDLLLVAYLILSWKKPTINPLLMILIFINTIFSAEPLLSLFFWSKLVLYILFFLSLSKTPKLKKLIYAPLLASTILIIFIQFTQLFHQASIGGLFYYFGERAFSFYTPNIAKINLPHLGAIIRPYSIFSHPNSLAGYLLIVLVIQKWPKAIKAFISTAIILTFSKIAIFTLFLLEIKNTKILRKITLVALLAGFLPLLVNFTNLNYTPDHSFLTRAYMGFPTTEIIKQNFFTGTGLRAFIPSLAQHLAPSHLNLSSLQPVHSLPLLILSELGIFGLVLLATIVKKFKNPLLIQILLILALTGAVDHYWWTLPQNQLILILALASLSSRAKSRDLSRMRAKYDSNK
jgi:hypothetical protein